MPKLKPDGLVFQTTHQAKRYFRQYRELKDEEDNPHLYMYDIKLNFGDYILFRHLDYNQKPALISKPILAIYIESTLWDMAEVLNFVEIPRSYDYKYQLESTGRNGEKYYWYTFEAHREVELLPMWFDNIKLLARWDKKPSFSEIRSAMKDPHHFSLKNKQ